MPLSESLLKTDRRPQVVHDLAKVIDAEVKSKKGMAGMAVKAGYVAVRKVSPTVTTSATDRMLPDFATALDPFWDHFVASGEQDFGSFLAARSGEVSDALLKVTDERAARTEREPLKRAYGGLRGKAKDHVIAALPSIGSTLQQHVD